MVPRVLHFSVFIVFVVHIYDQNCVIQIYNVLLSKNQILAKISELGYYHSHRHE